MTKYKDAKALEGHYIKVTIDSIEGKTVFAHYEDPIHGRIDGQIEPFSNHFYSIEDLNHCKSVGDGIIVKYTPNTKYPFSLKEMVNNRCLNIANSQIAKTVNVLYVGGGDSQGGYFLSEDGLWILLILEEADYDMSAFKIGCVYQATISNALYDFVQDLADVEVTSINPMPVIGTVDVDSFKKKAYTKFFNFHEELGEDAFYTDNDFEVLSVDDSGDLYVTTRKDGYKDVKNKHGHSLIHHLSRYTSILLSKSTDPIYATVNCDFKKSTDTFIRGILSVNDLPFPAIKFKNNGKLSTEYNFIDGVDRGLARVNKIIEGEKKWGIINTSGEVVVNIEYDNIWNFYGKNRLTTRAEKDGLTTEIHLSELPGYMNAHNVTRQTMTFDSINLRNFQRFEHFDNNEALPLGGITFLVGRNNAGKSTLLRAMRLLMQNISSVDLLNRRLEYDFCESKNGMKCFSKYCYNGDSNKIIVMSAKIGPCTMIFHIVSDESHDGSNFIKTIEYRHDKCAFNLTFDCTTLSAYIHIREENLDIDFEHRFSNDIFSNQNEEGIYILPIKELSNKELLQKYIKEESITKEVTDLLENTILSDFNQAIASLVYFYHIPVYSAQAEELYDLRNSTDFATSVVKQFYTTFASDNPTNAMILKFVRRWLWKMEIGMDIKIVPVENTSSFVSVEIQQKEGQWRKLHELGSGSIHFAILLISMASFIEQSKDRFAYSPILLIEEPEQNLHPMLQSYLADFLWEIRETHKSVYDLIHFDRDKTNVSSGIQIIVETHSEYLVRRSQILVRDFCREVGSINESPFRTLYLPSTEGDYPYDLEYRESGHFNRKFGIGFYDEASMLTYNIL